MAGEACDGLDNDGDMLVDNNDPDLPALCDTSASLHPGETEHSTVVYVAEGAHEVAEGTVFVDVLFEESRIRNSPVLSLDRGCCITKLPKRGNPPTFSNTSANVKALSLSPDTTIPEQS